MCVLGRGLSDEGCILFPTRKPVLGPSLISTQKNLKLSVWPSTGYALQVSDAQGKQ